MKGFYFHLLLNLLALPDATRTECIRTTLQVEEIMSIVLGE